MPYPLLPFVQAQPLPLLQASVVAQFTDVQEDGLLRGLPSVGGQIILLGLVAQEGTGVRVRQFSFFTPARLVQSESNHWVIDLGAIVGSGRFQTRATIRHHVDGGVPGGIETFDLVPVVLYDRNEFIAVRLTPVGSPPDLVGCAVVLHKEVP